jgi:lipopolysaccharide/colanic/teichoic acid biosynthesis glycosyltransferase
MMYMQKGKWGFMTAMPRTEDVRGPAGIYKPSVFQTLLRHERSRSDRDGGEFSLAVFDIIGIASDSRQILQTTSHIREKMRSIDEVGWLNGKSIGVILPLTNIEGGERFAIRVMNSLSKHSAPILWKVYSYPTHWIPGVDRVEQNERDGHNGSGYPDGGNGSSKARQDGNRQSFEDIIGDLFCHRVPIWKRCIDVIGSLLLMIALSPLFIIVAFYIECVSPGAVFFKQKRVGYKGRIFTFFKFRTMYKNNDASAHREYLKELINSNKPMEKLDGGRDPRIIPGGKILRKACIDELPQLFNVLRGDMSLVGPRPCISYEAAEYLRWHTHRFDILPGMTGLWQVSGKNKLSFAQMIRLDISYANRMSIGQDLKILLLTFPAILGLVFDALSMRIGKRLSKHAEGYVVKQKEEETLFNA